MIYTCIDCKYETFDKSRYDRHLITQKHLNKYKGNIKTNNNK